MHRDIKPDNIILRCSDGKPVLIDFGAVKEMMGTVLSPSGNSSRSIAIGTPGFMPSEQSAGRPVYSSDLYSLGLTAIYLLTGKMPEQIKADHRTGEIVWRQYALSISPSFAAVLDKAIQPSSRDRFSTAREMLEVLQSGAAPIPPAVPSPQPTVATPQTVLSSTPSSAQQDGQKMVAINSLIAGGTVGTAIIVSLVFTRPPQTSPPAQQLLEQPAAQQNSSPQPSFPSKALQSVESTASSEPSVSPSVTSELSYNFPMSSCGDPDPPGVNTWYPVFVNNSEQILRRLRFQYCGDAFRKYSEQRGRTYIQAASFLSQAKAQEFANFMQTEVGSGEVGDITQH